MTGKGYYDLNVTPGQWNHFTIKNNSFNTGSGMDGNCSDVCGYMLDGMAAGNEYIVTNLCYTTFIIPEVNTKYELKKQLDGFHWDFEGISDAWASKQTFETFDASQYEFLEFDMYISSASPKVAIRLFFVDSTNEDGNEGRGFKDLIVDANQWEHCVVERKSFDTGYNMNGKWSILSGFMLDALNGDNAYAIYNLCFTNRKQAVPYDEGDRDVKPDSDARYISTCETPLEDFNCQNQKLYLYKIKRCNGNKNLTVIDKELFQKIRGIVLGIRFCKMGG